MALLLQEERQDTVKVYRSLTTERSTFSPSVIKCTWKMKTLSLHVVKHHKPRRHLRLFFGNSGTQELTLGTNVSPFAITLYRTVKILIHLGYKNWY
jgi:hypothetical protein